MDWFRSGLAEAQRRAQEASEHAQKLAAQYSAQAKEQGTWLAEQAAVQAKQLKEKAAQEAQAVQARFAEYQAAQKAAGAAAGAEELARYAITDELCEFVSGLTYSTFSDMDMDALARSNKARAAPSDNNEDGTRLNPWQERHAMLVLSKVEQLQHLRFALCPKRMSDEQFWMVYFSLTAPLQPPEAFGRSPHPTSQQEQRQDAASPAGKHSREGDGVQGQGHSKASSRTGSSRDRQHEHEAASSSRAGQQGGKTGARGWDAWEDGDDDLEGWEEGPSGAGGCSTRAMPVSVSASDGNTPKRNTQAISRGPQSQQESPSRPAKGISNAGSAAHKETDSPARGSKGVSAKRRGGSLCVSGGSGSSSGTKAPPPQAHQGSPVNSGGTGLDPMKVGAPNQEQEGEQELGSQAVQKGGESAIEKGQQGQGEGSGKEGADQEEEEEGVQEDSLGHMGSQDGRECDGEGSEGGRKAGAQGGGSESGVGEEELEEGGDLDDLENDPELAAYLQEAMNVGDEEGEDDGLGSGSISDVDDLDDYINQLDAELAGEPQSTGPTPQGTPQN